MTNTKHNVPEKQLQLSALLGGWIGGMIAMQKFKHKTVKQEFRVPYFICTGINAVACLGFGLLWMRSPALRAKVTHSLKGMGLPV
ncbi:hypothetical protein HDV06_005125 [Boothiomyces sp. JEL0866]|nr:hypothetical protein HDV06_005125 [Boothiomyces sp. JEL0866]